MNRDPKIFKYLMALLTKTGMQGRRHAICYDYSKGRTESSKDLDNTEMLAIINDLEKGFKELDRSDLMRKKIISMAHEMGWSLSPTLSKGDGVPKMRIDIKRIDAWCVKYGQFNKGFNAHSYLELTMLVTQFENYYKSFLKSL